MGEFIVGDISLKSRNGFKVLWCMAYHEKGFFVFAFIFITIILRAPSIILIYFIFITYFSEGRSSDKNTERQATEWSKKTLEPLKIRSISSIAVAEQFSSEEILFRIKKK